MTWHLLVKAWTVLQGAGWQTGCVWRRPVRPAVFTPPALPTGAPSAASATRDTLDTSVTRVRHSGTACVFFSSPFFVLGSVCHSKKLTQTCWIGHPFTASTYFHGHYLIQYWLSVTFTSTVLVNMCRLRPCSVLILPLHTKCSLVSMFSFPNVCDVDMFTDVVLLVKLNPTYKRLSTCVWNC